MPILLVLPLFLNAGAGSGTGVGVGAGVGTGTNAGEAPSPTMAGRLTTVLNWTNVIFNCIYVSALLNSHLDICLDNRVQREEG